MDAKIKKPIATLSKKEQFLGKQSKPTTPKKDEKRKGTRHR